MKIFLPFLLIFLFSSCSSLRPSATFSPGNRLHFLAEYDVPYNKSFEGTIVGGLSGIDYDAGSGNYYLISDDRSAINPARFYTARIPLSEKGIDSVQFTSVHYLKNAAGRVYPNSKQDPAHTPDPEALRFDARRHRLVWSSEGERITGRDTLVLEDPSITIANEDGQYLDSFVLPSNLHMHAQDLGPRRNGVFEGLSFADNFKTVYVSVEEPLYEDGPRAGLKDSTGWIRIIKYDVDHRRPLAQYAYLIDPVTYPANPPAAFKINGVPDVLWAGKDHLLVLERSFSTGRKPCAIRLYLADLSQATNVDNVHSLSHESGWKPVSKSLVLNMDDLGMYTDNIEGMCFGPRLANGHRTLVFVADNNFSDDQITQFLVFEVE